MIGHVLTSHIIQVFYIQPFAVSKGVSNSLAFYSIAILSKPISVSVVNAAYDQNAIILDGASLLGRVAPLIASDQIGPSNVLVVCVAAASVSVDQLYCHFLYLGTLAESSGHIRRFLSMRSLPSKISLALLYSQRLTE